MSRKIWFPAKRYGYGWGPPTCWQGWVVLSGYLALVLAGIPSVRSHPYFYAGWVAVLTAGLWAICRRKGEPLRWRWGSRDQ